MRNSYETQHVNAWAQIPAYRPRHGPALYPANVVEGPLLSRLEQV